MNPSDQQNAMRFYLRPDVHMAAVGEDLVFLDVASDRYHCLPGAAAAIGRRRSGIDLQLNDRGLVEALQVANLTFTGASTFPDSDHQKSAAIPDLPTSSAAPEDSERLQARDVPEMFLALLDLYLHYRRRSFELIIARVVRSRRHRNPCSGHPDLPEVVRRFHRWSPYLPTPSKCLLRSFMLLRLLHRHGHDATWVFGVATWPFRAHCWVQVGDIVLDDDWEHVAGFVPILAV